MSETFLDDNKSQKQLEEELGKGVEKTPELTTKPEVELSKLDLSGAFNVRGIIGELEKLPDIKEADKQTDKYAEYLELAKKIWTIKQAEYDSFKINLKVGTKNPNTNKWKWQRKDGQQVYETKEFYYSPVSIQEKDELFRLLLKRQNASNEVTLMGIRLRKIQSAKDEQGAEEFMTKTNFDLINNDFYQKNQEYYVEAFKAYFGPEEDDLARISFEDIVDYSDVAIRKEGVKSPQ